MCSVELFGHHGLSTSKPETEKKHQQWPPLNMPVSSHGRTLMFKPVFGKGRTQVYDVNDTILIVVMIVVFWQFPEKNTCSIV